MDTESRDKLLLERLHYFNPKFLDRDDAIRSGEVCLRGTRLTYRDVIQIAENGELSDYPDITQEQVEACRNHAFHVNLCVKDCIEYSLHIQFQVDPGEWDQINPSESEEKEVI